MASDGAQSASFGHSVSISSDTAVVGANRDCDNGILSGSAYAFRYDGASWVEEAKLLASDGQASEEFGYAVAISGDAAVIGANYDNDNGGASGSAYVFRYDGVSWVQDAKLLASDGAAGDWFGFSVSISGDTAVIGAALDDDNGSDSGSAYVFRYDGSTWAQEAKLLASDGAPDNRFGWSVAISGDTAVIGACRDDDSGSYSGSAYVFRYDGAGWVQQAKLLASDAAVSDTFGGSAAISGDAAVIGADGDDDNGSSSGLAYVFQFDRVHTVCWDGSGHFTTIQDAIDVAFDGDEVAVCDGTYTGADNRNLDFGGKAIAVHSENGPADCTIDCQNSGRGFTFHSGETNASILDGFTILNGQAPSGGGIYCENASPAISHCTISGSLASDGSGGGIYCGLNSSPTINQCTINSNTADDEGGGVACLNGSNPTITDTTIKQNTSHTIGGGLYCDESSPVVSNCDISGNGSDSYGGGVACNLSEAQITDCTIEDNSAGTVGGGIACTDESDLVITNCRVTENTTAFDGGGVYSSDSSPQMNNCTLWRNTASFGGGGIYVDGGSPTIANCILWDDLPGEITVASGSLSVSYSDVEGGWAGTGNVDADPKFVAGLYLCHLDAGQSADSPCMDAGNPGSPMIEGATRTDGVQDAGIVDMAYHHPGPACFGDLNGDGYRNVSDFTLFAGAYGSHIGDVDYNPDADLNGNGFVNATDFTLFAGFYGVPCP
jgi:hypothetical protein